MPKTQFADLAVLVVDDHMFIRNDIERRLKIMGFSHIDHASNVHDATSKLDVMHYDIIFLDWNMPGGNGYSLLQQCREDTRYDKAAFVIVSAMSEERYIVDALKAGATSYIVKPVDDATLKEHMFRVVDWIRNSSRRGSS